MFYNKYVVVLRIYTNHDGKFYYTYTHTGKRKLKIKITFYFVTFTQQRRDESK